MAHASKSVFQAIHNAAIEPPTKVANIKTWLEKAMIEGMEAVLNSNREVVVPVEVEGRTAVSWEDRG